jgi:hypothetical protein
VQGVDDGDVFYGQVSQHFEKKAAQQNVSDARRTSPRSEAYA